VFTKEDFIVFREEAGIFAAEVKRYLVGGQFLN